MEGARLQKMLKAAAVVEARRAVEKARRAGVQSDSGCCSAPVTVAINQVQLESSYLNARTAFCPVFLRTPVQPQSVRIAALIEATTDAYDSPNEPGRRFVEYQRPIILPPCPPVDPNVFNASQGFRQIICPRPRNYYGGL
jgi:hypothetical protein